MPEHFIKRILAEELFGNRLCESMTQQNKINFMYRKLLLEALVGEPLTIDELRDLLQKRIVDFEFVKLNGEVRPARGTTNLKFVPAESQPKGTGQSSPTVATFFDLKKQLWRSVSQRSKEIVLTQDIPGKHPLVTVSDKDKSLINKLDRFETGKTYEYINRYGESGHTVTVMEVVEKGYYLKLDKTGPLFYLTTDTANKRIKNELTSPRAIVQPAAPSNKAVAKVRELINEPPLLVEPKKPLNIKDDTKKAYDVKDEEIVVPSNILEPTVELPSPTIKEPEIEEPSVEEEPIHELPYKVEPDEEDIKNKQTK